MTNQGQQLAEQKKQLTEQKEALEKAVNNAVSVIEHSYLERLDKLPIVHASSEELDIKLNQCGELYHLTHVVYSKDERFLDKLVTVVNVAASLKGSLVTLVRGENGTVSYYLGILSKRHRRNSPVDRNYRDAVHGAFSGAVMGNFIGSSLEPVSDQDIEKLEADIFNQVNSIASVSGLVTLRGQADETLRGYVQGIENLTDAMEKKNYTILMIADPVAQNEIQAISRGYERIYTELSAFSQTQLSVSEQGSLTLSLAQTQGITHGITRGVSQTQSVGKNTTKNVGAHIGIHGGLPFIGGSLGVNAGFSSGTNESSSTGQHEDHIEQKSKQDTRSVAEMLGSGKSVQITIKDRTVQSLMEQIDQYLKRLNNCKSFGAFSCAAYILSDKQESTLSAASIYGALMRGEESFLQTSQIGLWNRPSLVDDQKKADDYKQLISYLQAYTHPCFQLAEDVEVTPASLVSGQELAIQFGLPKKSIQGLRVTEMAAFGRNVDRVGANIHIGNLYHMGQEMEGETIPLNADSLASHVFVTGSTGSGKSNAIYTLLDKLCLVEDSAVKFLIIEPVKGEYKEIFGGYSGVEVYGTNPKKAKLLRLNPFSFPQDTHVLEHIDRLVEVFNACWPMYAAMPAVLKAAIEQAYLNCGWSLTNSSCPMELYPTFRDVMRALPLVIDSKGFSGDTQGDYKGALLTRLESLTNGINGQLLCAGEEIAPEDLFEHNVIADLSRVGSVETKALLMGVLVMKLQEYRMGQGIPSNSGLRHVTVLEEAHNLLRRTSTSQFQESANLQGKSVEMLTNAIAEMRTYGEGFIIADQSPGLLDMAAIRNTNTKLILRLPDESDRILVGKAAGLTESQIVELSRLRTGVAAVYQNNWVEPILCKLDFFDRGKHLPYVCDSEVKQEDVSPVNNAFFLEILTDQKDLGLPKTDVERLKRWIWQIDTGSEAKQLLLRMAKGERLSHKDMLYAVYCAVKGQGLLIQSRRFIEEEAKWAYIERHICEHLKVSKDVAHRVYEAVQQCDALFGSSSGRKEVR